MTERTVLMVCPQFPPSTLAGVHRGRHLAKHLPSAGWRPIVITIDERRYTERLDPALAALVPPSLDLIRTDAVPARLARLAGIGDISIRSFPFLRAAIAKAVADFDPDVVFITGAPFYPLLLSRWIKQRLGKPVVLDLQDPWVSKWGGDQPAYSKAGLSHRLAVCLEPRALRHAAFITSVSDIQNAELAARYPWLDPSRLAAIPIGGDPEDTLELTATPINNSAVTLDPAKLEFSYVGSVWPRAIPAIEVLFSAMAMLAHKEPELAGRMRLNFVGTNSQPNDSVVDWIKPLIDKAGIAAFVREFPKRAPYLEALSVMANSHSLLLVGSDEPHYTASKIYPALMSGRPFLSLFHRASSAHAILSAAGGGYTFAFETPAELAALVPEISRALSELARTPEAAGKVKAEVIAPYTAAAVARRFAAIFDKVASTA